MSLFHSHSTENSYVMGIGLEIPIGLQQIILDIIQMHIIMSDLYNNVLERRTASHLFN